MKSVPLISKIGKLIVKKYKHYLELYSKENSITKDVLDVIQSLSILEDLNSETTKEELNKATDALACGKAICEDSIPPEIIKCSKPVLLKPLHRPLSLCWREGNVPQDMCI